MLNNRSTATLKTELGTIDATALTAVFASLNIDEYIANSYSIVIPSGKASKKCLEDALSKIKTLSGRRFHCTEENDRLIISWKTQYKSIFPNRLDREETVEYQGVIPGTQILPELIPGSKVLDIGAGDGTNALRMCQQFHCDMYALEPSFEKKDDFEKCQLALGQGKTAKLTLQDAVAQFPHTYLKAFDAVTIFKFNVPYDQYESFFAALAEVIKPGGTIYITCVERERLDKNPKLPTMYIMDHLKKHFNFVSFKERSTDGEITCIGPKCLKPVNESLLRIAKR